MKIFIPIKENSQRVKRKNFRKLDGKIPLYKRTLYKFSDHTIYVDTDSDEILREIKRDPKLSHVIGIKRKDYLMGDAVSVCELIKDFAIENGVKEPIAQIHVTSPFLKEQTLRKAYESLHLGSYDSVVSCNVLQTRLWRKEGYGYCPVNHNPLKLEQTQDLPEYYEENSAFYIFEPHLIALRGNRIGEKPLFYPVSHPENFDIDTEQDWTKAKMMEEMSQTLLRKK